jgi:spore maturation protein CgeB
MNEQGDKSMAGVPYRAIEPGRTMMTIANGGRMSRHWLAGLGAGADKLGLRHVFIEIDAIRAALAKSPGGTIDELNRLIVQRKIGLVLNYALNAAAEFPVDRAWPGAYRNFFEVRGVAQCFLWADHPQWVSEKAALAPATQAVLRSGNQSHFLKSQAHADEIARVLGWPNCYELPCGADTDVLRPAANAPAADFDLVAVYGGDVERLPAWLEEFVAQDDPDPAAIDRAVAKQVESELASLWEKEAPANMRAELAAWSAKMVAMKLDDSSVASFRYFQKLADEFPAVSWWLAAMYPVYFKAMSILYAFRNWQRHFYLAWLSRYFRVGLFGGKWDRVGEPADRERTGGWVDFPAIPAAVARGKVVLDIVSGWDEEGLTAKTFELAACGAAMVHNRCQGLEKLFVPGVEMELFDTPAQLRQTIRRLIGDEKARREMSDAARQRVVAEHTWAHRVRRMLELARLPIGAFAK